MDDKNLTVITRDESGMPKMVADLFRQDIFLVREVIRQLDNKRDKNFEMYKYFAEEFKKASRSKLFGGFQNDEELLDRALDFALKKTQEFQGAFREQDEDLINRTIRVANETSEQFLSAVKGALTGNGNNQCQDQLQGPGETGQFPTEGIFTRMTSK
jgi:hypothetical protein